MAIPTQGDFDSDMQDIQTKQTDMTDGINSCVDKFNNFDFGCWSNTFSKDSQEKIRDALNNLTKIWSDFLTEMVQYASPGWPFWFLDAQDNWLAVKTGLSGQKVHLGAASSSSFPATQSWVSADGAVYRNMPAVQGDAIDGVVGHAGSFASHLGDHGLQIIDFWVKIANKFVDYGQLVATSVANFISADPTKWLDIVSEIVNVVSELIDFVQDLIQLIVDKWLETLGQMQTLENDLADVSGSIAGQWPTIERLA
ncbi:hypothetical protein [Agromyces atrinae]|uniref:Uncharacterized protein n=1 Tax=Agromyces atrinae TaxID=592376 RepID=A0A4Q2M6I3_9MICO|nr:hypothetical protein [Agromyces atrinae]NYD65693.1 hypothetical protein [Agromyces atrinae]RXZ85491.1 hypothetical protein ESP50_14905 [Agromyces atrinae]